MSETPKNWNKLTVADLKDELQTRGLPTSGRKSELIDRLILHDSEGVEDEEQLIADISETINDELNDPVEATGEEDELPVDSEINGETEEGIEGDVKEEEEANEMDAEENEDKTIEEAKQEEIEDVLDAGEEGDNVEEVEDRAMEQDLGEAGEGGEQGQEDDTTLMEQEEYEDVQTKPEEENSIQEDNEGERESVEQEEDKESLKQEVKVEECLEQEDKEGEEESVEQEEKEEGKDSVKRELKVEECLEHDEKCKGQEDVDEQQIKDIDESNQENKLEEKNISMEEQQPDQVKEETEDKMDENEADENTELMDQSTEHYGIEEADLIILDELIEAEELKMSSEEQEDSQKDGSEKKDDGQQSETKGPELLPPMPPGQFSDWISQQLQVVQKERKWKITNVKSKDPLLNKFMEFAKDAVEFSVSYSVDGRGSAILKYLTIEKANSVHNSLKNVFGKDNVGHFYDGRALTTKTIVVQGLPTETTEEDVYIFFPEAIFISRLMKRRNMKVRLPEDIENDFLVQFFDELCARKAVRAIGKIKDKYSNAVLKQAKEYVLEYRKWEAEERSIYQEKKKQELMTKVFSDSERVEMCKALKTIQGKVTGLKSGQSKEKDKLKQQMLDVRKAIDADTIERVRLKLDFPEPERLMTSYTKDVYHRQAKPHYSARRRDDSSSRRDGRSETGIVDLLKMPIVKPGDPSRDYVEDRPEQRQFMEDNVKTQLANIHKDPKGLYTVSILREGNIFDNSVASDMRRIFRRFGTIRDYNMTRKRLYVRFQYKEEVVAVVKELGAIPHYEVMVPTKDHKQRELASATKAAETKGKGSEKEEKPAKKETDKKEAAKKEPTKQETDKKEPAKQETDKKETDKKEKDKKEEAEQETDKKEEAKKEPVNETPGKETPDKANPVKTTSPSQPVKVVLSDSAQSIKQDQAKEKMDNYGPTSLKTSSKPQEVVIPQVVVKSQPPAMVYLSQVCKFHKKDHLKEQMLKFGKVLTVRIENHRALCTTTTATVTFENAAAASAAISAKLIKIGSDVINIHSTPQTAKPTLKPTVNPAATKTPAEAKPNVTSPAARTQSTTSNQTPEANKTVFVRNLSALTTAKMLTTHFGSIGPIQQVQILRDKNTNKSKGLATVMFKDVNSVQKVLKIKTHVIDGRNLSVEQYSKRDTRGSVPLGVTNRKPAPTSAPQKLMQTPPKDGGTFQQRNQISGPYPRGGQVTGMPYREQRPADFGRGTAPPQLLDMPISAPDRPGRARNAPREEPRRDSSEHWRNYEGDAGRGAADQFSRDRYYEGRGNERDVQERGYYDKQDRYDRYPEDQNNYGRDTKQGDVDLHAYGKYYENKYSSENTRDRREDRDMRFEDNSYNRGTMDRYSERKYDEPARYGQQQGIQEDRMDRYDDRYEMERKRERNRDVADRYGDRDMYSDISREQAAKRKMVDYEERGSGAGDFGRDYRDRRSDQRGYRDEQTGRDDREGSAKRRRVEGNRAETRPDSPLMESDAMVNVLKTIGQVISNKMEEIGKMDPGESGNPDGVGSRSAQSAMTGQMLPGPTRSQANPVAGYQTTATGGVVPKAAVVGGPQLMQRQQQMLQQQQALQRHALEQQAALQQQQLLMRKKQEQQLQQELMELQKMKEAALREAQASYGPK